MSLERQRAECSSTPSGGFVQCSAHHIAPSCSRGRQKRWSIGSSTVPADHSSPSALDQPTLWKRHDARPRCSSGHAGVRVGPSTQRRSCQIANFGSRSSSTVARVTTCSQRSRSPEAMTRITPSMLPWLVPERKQTYQRSWKRVRSVNALCRPSLKMLRVQLMRSLIMAASLTSAHRAAGGWSRDPSPQRPSPARSSASGRSCHDRGTGPRRCSDRCPPC